MKMKQGARENIKRFVREDRAVEAGNLSLSCTLHEKWCMGRYR